MKHTQGVCGHPQGFCFVVFLNYKEGNRNLFNLPSGFQSDRNPNLKKISKNKHVGL